MKKNYSATLMVVTTIALALFTFGCDSQGTAEKAGEAVDQAVESTQDAAGEVADKITGQGPAEEAGESIDETAEEMGESMDETAEEMQ